MASAAYERRKARAAAGLTKPNPTISFGYAVTPKYFARKATAECQRAVGRDIAHLTTDRFGYPLQSGRGWRDVLSSRVAQATGQTEAAFCRRLWDMENGKGRMNKTAMIELMVVASGLIYGLDVIVPRSPATRSWPATPPRRTSRSKTRASTSTS
jgi:hypothetical protein